jgi:hypothetical protein
VIFKDIKYQVAVIADFDRTAAIKFLIWRVKFNGSASAGKHTGTVFQLRRRPPAA